MNSIKKIVSIAQLKREIKRLRDRGLKIAFTNGCFDIVHAGHVHYLQEAKKDDRILIVGLNSDRSVKQNKGPLRPVIPQGERARLLGALGCVDFVTIFSEKTPESLIRIIRPDILIKGADWNSQKIAGGDFVKGYGGKVEFIKYLRGISTTNIIRRILEISKREAKDLA